MSGYDPYEADKPDAADPFEQNETLDDAASSLFEDDLSEPIAPAAGGSDQSLDTPEPISRSYVPSHPVPSEIAATQIRCTSCGYNLTGVTIGGSCPECGKSVSESILMGSNPITSGLSVASMVVGIIAIFASCIPFIGVVLPLGGLPMGIIGLNQSKAGAYTSASRGMAIAGIITNAVALTIQGLILLSLFT